MDTSPNRNKFNISFDLRYIVVALLLIIAALVLLWKPWENASATGRTISVTGDTTVRAEPDEYQFNPTYIFKGTDTKAAIDAARAKQAEVTAKLKALGVTDKQIKTNVNGYEDYNGGERIAPSTTDTYNYSLFMTITQPDKASAQKIQDYLATTSPQGAVTPNPTFSEKLRKQLESKARDAATRDARAKADQSAKNLGFKITGVKSVDDESGLGGGPWLMRDGVAGAVEAKDQSIASPAVQPGENELSYSVTVVYTIR